MFDRYLYFRYLMVSKLLDILEILIKKYYVIDKIFQFT